MQRYFRFLYFIILVAACNSSTNQSNERTGSQDVLFNAFQPGFLDAYWKENPSGSIFAGYGKYYDQLIIPDSNSFVHAVAFSKQWLDSLHAFAYDKLSDDNKINYSIIQNQLQGTIWYIDTFKIQQRDPSSYNLGGECYYLLTRNYAPLTQRLQTLSTHMQHAADYYAAAQSIIDHPTKEYTNLAINQNEGSMDVFGSALEDSIKASSLTDVEKDTLHHRIATSVAAIKNYIAFLKKISADKNYTFSDFRIGKTLFEEKFKYDLVTDYAHCPWVLRGAAALFVSGVTDRLELQ